MLNPILAVGKKVRILYGDNKGIVGVIANLNGPNASITTSDGNTVTTSLSNIAVADIESYNKDLYNLLSTYNKSISGYTVYLLQARNTGNLYIQLVNLSTYEIKGPLYVGPGKNNPSFPIEGNFDMGNTSFRFEDRERNTYVDDGRLIIIGSTTSNKGNKDSFRYISNRPEGPWELQIIYRMVD